MSLESSRIIEEAKKKASEIIEEAQKTALSIINEAEKKWREKAEIERQKIISEAEAQAGLIIAEAKRHASFVVEKAKAELVEEVYKRLYDILTKESYDVEASLRALIKEALVYVNTPEKIIVKKNHVDITKKVLSELGYSNVEVEGSDDIIGGVIVVSKEGVIVDNRVETRLNQSKERLLNLIARVLFGDS